MEIQLDRTPLEGVDQQHPQELQGVRVHQDLTVRLQDRIVHLPEVLDLHQGVLVHLQDLQVVQVLQEVHLQGVLLQVADHLQEEADARPLRKTNF